MEDKTDPIPKRYFRPIKQPATQELADADEYQSSRPFLMVGDVVYDAVNCRGIVFEVSIHGYSINWSGGIRYTTGHQLGPGTPISFYEKREWRPGTRPTSRITSTRPRVLVLDTKYETLFFDASSIEVTDETALEIVRMFRDDYKYYKSILNPQVPPSPVMPPADLEKQPEVVRRAWDHVVNEARLAEHRYRDLLIQFKLLEAANAGDGVAAWNLIKMRSDDGYQYETFKLHFLHQIELQR